MLFLNIATGVILVLLGMRYLRKGLDRLFGNQLVEWLQATTRNRVQGFFAGMVAGVIAPSSSAIAMLSVQMLNQSALTAGRMLAVVLGANVGLTVSVQLITFRLQDYSGLFLLLGGIGFLFLQRALFRGTGQIFLGIGLVFLAMGIIASAGSAAAANPDLKLLFAVVEHYPLVVFVAIALLTFILQSSTASIGLGIGLAEAGLLPNITMVPWVLGANLGITLTMMLAGWGSTEGRRLAIGSLLIKGCGAALILLGSSNVFLFILRFLPGAIDRQTANLNTLFNLVIGLIALPLLSAVSRLVGFLVESKPIDESREPDSYLDPLLLETPSLALNQAIREVLRLIDELKVMLRTVWLMIWGHDIRLQSSVKEHQQRLNRVQENLKDYLSQVSDENLSEEDVEWKFVLLDYSQELTAIGMLIVRELCDAAVRHIQSNIEPLPEDKAEVETFYVRTLERMEKVTLLVMSRHAQQAEEFIREKEQINVQVRLLRKARLEKPLPAQAASASILDIISCLRRVNSQLTSLGYAIIHDRGQSGSAKGPLAVADEEDTGSSSIVRNDAGKAESLQKDLAQPKG
jgi:phosphate:Na+ symporter